MERRAATTEREKAELRESLEEQAAEWRSRQEQYERELTEMKASLVLLNKEIQHFRDQVSASMQRCRNGNKRGGGTRCLSNTCTNSCTTKAMLVTAPTVYVCTAGLNTCTPVAPLPHPNSCLNNTNLTKARNEQWE